MACGGVRLHVCVCVCVPFTVTYPCMGGIVRVCFACERGGGTTDAFLLSQRECGCAVCCVMGALLVRQRTPELLGIFVCTGYRSPVMDMSADMDGHVAFEASRREWMIGGSSRSSFSETSDLPESRDVTAVGAIGVADGGGVVEVVISESIE